MRRYWMVAVLVLVSLMAGFRLRSGEAKPAAEKEQVVVHLSSFTDDLHKAFMAVKLAEALQKHGAQVTLFLDIEGARIADKRNTLEVMWGPSKTPLKKYAEGFVEAGGRVLVCPHCAKAAGVTELREGAEYAEHHSMVTTLANAAKILDY